MNAPAAPAARRQPGDVIKAVLALAVVLVVVIVLAAIFLAGTSKHDLKGDVTLTDQAHPADVDATCQGTGGFADIEGGVPVTVKDERGKVLGTGALDPGSGDGTSCVFDFTVQSVHTNADFYAIEVGNRGAVTFSRKQLEGDQWFANLTLGQP